MKSRENGMKTGKAQRGGTAFTGGAAAFPVWLTSG